MTTTNQNTQRHPATREGWIAYASELADRWEAEGVTPETHVWFACHHNRLCEPIIGDIRQRLTRIANGELLDELPNRFASICVAPIEKLPKTVKAALTNWKRAYAELYRTHDEVDRAWHNRERSPAEWDRACAMFAREAKLYRAKDELTHVLDTHHVKLYRLYCKACPENQWDYEARKVRGT